jgi:hypothetical protein
MARSRRSVSVDQVDGHARTRQGSTIRLAQPRTTSAVMGSRGAYSFVSTRTLARMSVVRANRT